MAFKCDDFFGMDVRPVQAVSGATVFEVHHGEQTLSEPFGKRDDAIAYMFHLKNMRGTPNDPLADYWRSVARRVTAALYECEEGSDDPRAIQGGGGPSERLYKIIRGTRRRIDAYCRAHYNRYGDTLLVRFRP